MMKNRQPKKILSYVVILSFLWQNVLWAIGEPLYGDEDLRSSPIAVSENHRMAIVKAGNEQDGIVHNVFDDFHLSKDSGVVLASSPSTRVICNRVYNEESPISLAGVIETESSVPVIMANPGGIAVEGLDCRGFPHLALLAGHMAQKAEGLAYDVREGKVTINNTLFKEDEALKSLALAGRRVRVTNSLLSPEKTLTVLAGAKMRSLERDEDQKAESSLPPQASPPAPSNSIVFGKSTVLRSKRIVLQSEEVAGRILANGVLHATHEDIVIRALGDVYLNDIVSFGNLEIETTGRVFFRGTTRVLGHTRIKASYFESDKEFVSLKGLLLDVSHAMTFRDTVEVPEGFEARGGTLTLKGKVSAPQGALFTLESLKVGSKAVFTALGEGLRGTIGSVLHKGTMELSFLKAIFRKTLYEVGSLVRIHGHTVLRGGDFHNKGTVFTAGVYEGAFTGYYRDSGTFYAPTLLLLRAGQVTYGSTHRSFLHKGSIRSGIGSTVIEEGASFKIYGDDKRSFLHLKSAVDLSCQGEIYQQSTPFPVLDYFTSFKEESPVSQEEFAHQIASLSLEGWAKETRALPSGEEEGIRLKAARKLRFARSKVMAKTVDVVLKGGQDIKADHTTFEQGNLKENALVVTGETLQFTNCTLGGQEGGRTFVEGSQAVELLSSSLYGPQEAVLLGRFLKAHSSQVVSTEGPATVKGTEQENFREFRIRARDPILVIGDRQTLKKSSLLSATGPVSLERTAWTERGRSPSRSQSPSRWRSRTPPLHVRPEPNGGADSAEDNAAVPLFKGRYGPLSETSSRPPQDPFTTFLERYKAMRRAQYAQATDGVPQRRQLADRLFGDSAARASGAAEASSSSGVVPQRRHRLEDRLFGDSAARASGAAEASSSSGVVPQRRHRLEDRLFGDSAARASGAAEASSSSGAVPQRRHRLEDRLFGDSGERTSGAAGASSSSGAGSCYRLPADFFEATVERTSKTRFTGLSGHLPRQTENPGDAFLQTFKAMIAERAQQMADAARRRTSPSSLTDTPSSDPASLVKKRSGGSSPLDRFLSDTHPSSRKPLIHLDECEIYGPSGVQITHQTIDLHRTRALSPRGRVDVTATDQANVSNSTLQAYLSATTSGKEARVTGSTLDSQTGTAAVTATHSATVTHSCLKGPQTLVEAKRGTATVTDSMLDGPRNQVVGFRVEERNNVVAGDLTLHGDLSVQSHNLKAQGAVRGEAAYVNFKNTQAGSLAAHGHHVTTDNMEIERSLELRGKIVTQRGHTEAENTLIQALDQLEDSVTTSNRARGILTLDCPNNLGFNGRQTADTASISLLRMGLADLLERTTARFTNVSMPEADIVVDRLTHAHTTLALWAQRLEIKEALLVDGDFIARIQKQILQNSLVEAERVSMKAAHITVETPLERRAVPGGYQDVLGAPATTRARTGDVDVEATHSLESWGGRFEAKMNARLRSHGSLRLGAQYVTSEVQTGNGKDGTRLYLSVPHKTHIVAGIDGETTSDHDTTFAGLDTRVGHDMRVTVGGRFEDQGVTPFTQRTTTKTRKSWWRKSTHSETEMIAGFDPNAYRAGHQISFQFGGAASFQAPVFESPESPHIHSSGNALLFQVGKSTHTVQRQRTGKNPLLHTHRNWGHTHTTIHQGTVSSPKGMCVVGADPLDIEVGDGRAWESARVYPVSAPETAWISALKNRHPHTRLHTIPEIHEEWDQQVSSLTPGAAAIVALAVTLATQGAGASLIAPLIGALELGGTMAATVASTMASAMVSAGASRVAVSALGSAGNVTQFMNDLGSAQLWKGVALAGATAVCTRVLGDVLEVAENGLEATAILAGVSTMERLLQGERNVGRALAQGALTAGSSAVAAKGANAIGQAYKAGEMGFLAHKVVHASAAAALGAGSMAVLGNRDQIFTAATSAAASAVAAECVAEGLDAGLGDTWPRRTLGTAAIFAGAFTGWATGDANAGSLAALNAIQNNFGMPSVYPDYEAERLKNEQAAREGIWTDQDDLVAFKQNRKVQAMSEVQNIDRALRQMGVLSPGQRSLLEDRDFALECVHFTESLPTSIGGVAFEGGNLVMTALPVVGAVGRAALQTARLGAHMAGSAVRATIPGLRGSAVSLLTTGQEVAQSLRFPSLRFANALAGEARVTSNEVAAFRGLAAEVRGAAPLQQRKLFSTTSRRTITFDYSTPEAAYSWRIDPLTLRGPMSIDSNLFTSATSYTELGAPRNAVQFWKLWEQKYPGALSYTNKELIFAEDLSPYVDSQWISHFPEHQHYMGQRLEHHHLDQSYLAVPLPWDLHRGAGNVKYWHN